MILIVFYLLYSSLLIVLFYLLYDILLLFITLCKTDVRICTKPEIYCNFAKLMTVYMYQAGNFLQFFCGKNPLKFNFRAMVVFYLLAR